MSAAHVAPASVAGFAEALLTSLCAELAPDQVAPALAEQLRFAFDVPLVDDVAGLASSTLDPATIAQRAGAPACMLGAIAPLRPHRGGRVVACVAAIELFAPLAAALEGPHGLWALYVPPEVVVLDGGVDALVERLAGHYVEGLAALEQVDVLCGFSFGGVVAFEIARQLKAAGRPTPALVALDPLLPSAFEKHRGRWLADRLTGAVKDPGGLVDDLRRRRAEGAARTTGHRPGEREDGATAAASLGPYGPAYARAQAAAARGRAEHGALAAYDKKQLRFAGDAHVVRASAEPLGPGVVYAPQKNLGGRIDGAVTTLEVACAHLPLVSPPFVADVAALLQPLLDDG